jgi:hypothetical protein
MPATVTRQHDILTAMLQVVELEPALRWFELGCSLGRNAGDELSDIDCGVGIADDQWPEALVLGARLAACGGPIIDTMRQAFPGRDGAHGWHLFTLYADGAQLSLVLMPSASRSGLPPGSVALYDADARLATPMRPPAADVDAATLREWAALGWIALGDLAKYLDRGSLWEAYARLQEARGEVFKLWAAGSKIDFPGYRLTAILDTPSESVPTEFEATVAALDATDLRRAALACADLLSKATDRVTPMLRDGGKAPPDGLPAWVRGRLRV